MVAMQVHSSLSPGERDELRARSKLSREEGVELTAQAAESGRVECLKVLHIRSIPPNDKTWISAATAGQLDVLRWLHSVQPWAHTTAASYAADAGHLDCFSFLHSIYAYWDEYSAMTTAKEGQLACLAFMIEHGCRLSSVICSGAAEGGRIDCLRYLHSQGCPWDAYTTRNAVSGGHLECLMFAVKRGCPVDDETLAAAVECGEEECLDYLLDQGFRPEEPLRIVRLYNDFLFDCLALLAYHGVDIHPGQAVYAASIGDLEMLRYFHSAGFPLWQTALDEFTSEALTEERSWYSWSMFVRYNALFVKAYPDTVSLWNGVLHIPPWDELLPACWATLRFGALHGAPLTPRAKALVEERQACAQEVVRCFHAARWLAAGGRRESTKWAAMSRVPYDVLMTIMELAEVEIREALH
jgi:hypothetical protein